VLLSFCSSPNIIMIKLRKIRLVTHVARIGVAKYQSKRLKKRNHEISRRRFVDNIHIFLKQRLRFRTGLNWLRVGSSGWFTWTQEWNFELHWIREFLSQLLATEGLNNIKSVSYDYIDPFFSWTGLGSWDVWEIWNSQHSIHPPRRWRI
jgi:hypothetical protein